MIKEMRGVARTLRGSREKWLETHPGCERKEVREEGEWGGERGGRKKKGEKGGEERERTIQHKIYL